jgi:hypothetical protein
MVVDGDGYSDGYGDYGHGNGYGSGGYGNGDGTTGDGYGDGTGGYGVVYGLACGYGETVNEDCLREYLAAVEFPPRHVFDLHNAEARRIAIEIIGADRFFGELGGWVVHQDTDGAGNQRRLVRVHLTDAEAGYLQAVHVVCPTTGREYYLGVRPDVTTCQEAVASTFNLKADEYAPVRES